MELFEWHADRKAESSDINSGHHPAVAQLRVDKIAIKGRRGQKVVRFDASYEVQFA